MMFVVDCLALFIIIASFLSVSFLAIGFFKPLIVVITSVLLTTISWLLFIHKNKNLYLTHISQYKNNHIFSIFLLILIALIFRCQPYLYIIGGQDEGVYVNMAAAFSKNGKVFQTDNLRKSITDKHVLEIYDNYNFRLNRVIKPRKYEGIYLLGVYIKNRQKSEYVFQFYPLHPLWMAIFGKLFGNKNCVWSLVFFSLLSILFFYLLTYELTNDQKIAFIAGFLSAINPLHAFFSKFPVTEVVALCFSLSSFYYLLKYYKLAQREVYIPLYLFLSLGLMGCFFFTRISGFMYMPFYYALIVLTILFVDNTKAKRHLLFYFFSILFVYAISVIYGLKYSFPYSYDIYNGSFSIIFGKSWEIRLLIMSILGLSSLILLKFNRVRNIFQLLIRKTVNFMPYLILLIILLGLYKAYLLGFTDKYIGNWWIDQRWHMAKKGLLSFCFSSIIVTIEYLSPFLFLLFLYCLPKYKRSVYSQILLVFLLGFWFYIAFLQWVIPYQYYYARYLLTEILPYTMLFVFCSLSNSKKTKYLALFLISLSAIYFIYFTSFQFKGKEAGAYISLSKISYYVDKEDILLLNKDNFRFYSEIKTPLVFFFNKNVFSYKNKDNLETILSSSLCSKYDDVFLLSQNILSKPYLELIDKLTYRQGVFEHIPFIPRKFFYLKTKLFLYKFKWKDFADIYVRKTNKIKIKNNPYLLVLGFYGDYVWTKGKGQISGFTYRLKNKRFLILETYGWNPYRGNIKKLNLKVFANGKELKFVCYKDKKYYFQIPKDMKEIKEITIHSNTFIPKKLGINNDTRKLGMDIKSISFE